MSHPEVILAPGKARPVWGGHPWIYSRAVQEVRGSGQPGDLALVRDARGQQIGWGHLGAGAPIAVRMLSFAPQAPAEDALIAERLSEAVARRASIGLPSAETTAYRLVHSEGDRLPGLVVDRLGAGLSVQLGTAAMIRLEGAVLEALRAVAPSEWVVVSTPSDASRIEQLPPSERVVQGELEGLRGASVLEHGVRFEIDPVGGQKTGFYADQRDNRARVASLCRGKAVLDAFCYGGGFGLSALVRGSAARAVLVDSSPRATRMAARNAEANGVDATVIESDAITYLRQQAPDESFDVVVLDPPKLARSRQSAPQALDKYRKINEHGIRALADGGILVSSSCSGHIGAAEFTRMLADAAFQAGRTLHVLEQRGQAACHPTLASAPEGAYLKCVIAEVRSR